MSYAALSAMTAKTIVGTRPFIKFNGMVATNLDQLSSFDMPDGSGGTVTIDPTVTMAINVRPGYKFNQFVAKVTADGIAKNLSTASGVEYGDNDGDTPHLTNSVAGTLMATIT